MIIRLRCNWNRVTTSGLAICLLVAATVQAKSKDDLAGLLSKARSEVVGSTAVEESLGQEMHPWENAKSKDWLDNHLIRLVQSTEFGASLVDLLHSTVRSVFDIENPALSRASLLYTYEQYEQTHRKLVALDENRLSASDRDVYRRLLMKTLRKLQKDKELKSLIQRLLTHDPAFFRSQESFSLASKMMLSFSEVAYQSFLQDNLDFYPFFPSSEQCLEQYISFMEQRRSKVDYRVLRRLAMYVSSNQILAPWLEKLIREGRLKIKGRQNPQILGIRLLIRMGHFAQAETYLQGQLAMLSGQDYYDHLRTLGYLFERQGRLSEAFELYRSHLDKHGRNRQTKEVWESYSRVLGRSGAFAEAAREYGSLSKIYARSYLRWYHFWYLYRSGRYQEAVRLVQNPRRIRRYLRDSKDKVGFDYWVGKAYENIGDRTLAKRYYQKILNQRASSYYAAMLLARWETDAALKQVMGDDIDVGPLSEKRLASIDFIDNTKLSGLYANYDEWVNDYSELDEYELPRKIDHLLTEQFSNRETWKVKYPLIHQEWLEKVSVQFEIDPLLLASVIRAESRYNPEAVSPVGARGLMQIMPYTAQRISYELGDERFVLSDLSNPRISIIYGGYYLRRLMNYFGNNIVLALAAYNAGPNKVREWVEFCGACTTDEFVESINFRETRRYVKAIVAYYTNYKRIYERELGPRIAVTVPERVEAQGEIY